MTDPIYARRGNKEHPGRHYQFVKDGPLFPSVTNIIGNKDKPALAPWAAREAAIYAMENLPSLSALPEEDAIKLIKGAPWKQRDQKADFGTEVHAYLEHDTALLPAHPAFGHVANAGEVLRHLDLKVSDAEVTLVSKRHWYAGTADVIAERGSLTALADWKTGKALYAEAAMQLVALMRCEWIVTADGEWEKAPSIDEGWAVRLGSDAGDWEAYQIDRGSDAERAAFKAFLGLKEVHEWKRQEAWDSYEPTFRKSKEWKK